MGYQKFRADQLFDGYQLLDHQQVLILADDGKVEAIVPAADAGEDVLQYEGILIPGLINCHCHLELSHMKGVIPERTGLVSFVQHIMQSRDIPVEAILSAIAAAEEEMLENGIVAVGDICNNVLTLVQKEKGRIRYHNFIEVSGFVPDAAGPRFEQATQVFAQFASRHAGSSSIVPHAPYSVAEELWKRILDFPGNHLLTIHNQESVGENELFFYKKGEFLDLYTQLNIDISSFQATGTSSLQAYLSKFLPDQSVILVHNVFTDKTDLDYCRRQAVYPALSWCLCPNANLYISDKLPDIDLLAGSGCRLVLGTDSLASNHQLSILSEIQTIRRYFPHISLGQLLGWATINGAKALKMDGLLGSFEKGKRPGLVLCDTSLSACTRLM